MADLDQQAVSDTGEGADFHDLIQEVALLYCGDKTPEVLGFEAQIRRSRPSGGEDGYWQWELADVLHQGQPVLLAFTAADRRLSKEEQYSALVVGTNLGDGDLQEVFRLEAIWSGEGEEVGPQLRTYFARGIPAGSTVIHLLIMGILLEAGAATDSDDEEEVIARA